MVSIVSSREGDVLSCLRLRPELLKSCIALLLILEIFLNDSIMQLSQNQHAVRQLSKTKPGLKINQY